MARIEAEDLFEIKAQIIQRMALYDPTGDWMARGARALDNPRTTSGEESLERLYDIWKDLQETGPLSDEFSRLQEKVFLKKGGPGGTLSHKVCKPFGMGFCFFLYFSICRFFASKERENKVGCNDVRICTNFYLFSD